MIQKFIVSRDDRIYEAFPEVALTASGRLVCVFSECTHHADRSYTRVMVTTSDDRGRTWAPKRPLTRPLRGDPTRAPYWDCASIATLSDGRLAAVVSRIVGRGEGHMDGEQSNWLWFSEDEGETWEGPHPTPVHGIVPDRLIELRHGPYAGRWILAAHTVLRTDEGPLWAERCWLSDDGGHTWLGPYTIAAESGLKLCEGSVLELPGGELVCFLRENSGQGLDAFKAISLDGGITWEGPYRMPMPGCHRPIAGMLQSGHVLVTHRFMQGGQGWLGWWTQNLFAALTDVESCLARSRDEAHTRIMPIDYDRSPVSDTGYSGWVQFPDGEIYVVNYIVDDAPKAYIRGYAFWEEDIVLPGGR
ncbi:MAG: exo-alpha-sialidase [Anaerolineae bacterium]|nr:exo-alpha-sialidase [Anaerolineae bacterium]